MLVIEILESGLVHTYSDANKYILQNETGLKYEEAIDIPNRYTYTETDEDIPHEDPPEEEENI